MMLNKDVNKFVSTKITQFHKNKRNQTWLQLQEYFPVYISKRSPTLARDDAIALETIMTTARIGSR